MSAYLSSIHLALSADGAWPARPTSKLLATILCADDQLSTSVIFLSLRVEYKALGWLSILHAFT